MTSPGGIDDEKLVAAEILDTYALGEDLKEVVAAYLDILIKGVELEPKDLIKNRHFYNAITDLTTLVNDKAKYEVMDQSEIAFCMDYLQKFDKAIVAEDFSEKKLILAIRDLQDIARRIIKAFTLSNPLTEEPAPEISKPRLKVTEMLARLLGLSHGK